MLATHEVRRDGPDLHVTLPDVLPPNWTMLRRDVDLDLDNGVERAFVRIPGAHHLAAEDERELISFERSLRELGVDVHVWRTMPFAEVFLG
jgi:hypothetical protein